MGRYANALDWSEQTDRGSGIAPRAFPALERSDSEIRLRQAPFERELTEEDAEPTRPFERVRSTSEIARQDEFLRDLGQVRSAVEALVGAAGGVAPALDAAIHSVVHAVGMWRTNVVRHVDEASSSLPEYAAAYTFAIVQPALAEAEACAVGNEGNPSVAALVRAVAASVQRLNATLRYRID